MVKKATKKISKKNEVVEKVNAEDVAQDDEPSWYHYLIVLLIMAAIIFIPWGIYTLYENSIDTDLNISNNNSNLVLTKFPYKKGNITYNLYFHNSILEIEGMNFPVQVNKLDLLNTQNFIMAFDIYNGTDNGEVTRGSTKMTSFLSTVYRFKFGENSFVRINQTNCENSTLNMKVITYNPYSNREGIFYNQSNGCIQFETNEPTHIVDLVDNLIYGVVTSE